MLSQTTLESARKQLSSQEILLWMTPSEAPKALQAPECSELLDPMRHFELQHLDPEVLLLDGPIRANRFAESRGSPDSRESFQGSQTEPLFCESRFAGPKNGESQVSN